MAISGRVHAVVGDAVRVVVFDRFGEDPLQGDEEELVLDGDLGCDGTLFVEVVGLPGLLVCADGDQERLEQDDPADTRVLCTADDVGIGVPIAVRGGGVVVVVAAPCVVDTDEDRDDIRVELEAVVVPPALVVAYSIRRT
jgi:hypothetical protein